MKKIQTSVLIPLFFLNARLKLNFGPPRVQHSNAQKRNRTKRFCTVSGHFKLFQRDTRPLLLYFQRSHSLGSLSLSLSRLCCCSLPPKNRLFLSLKALAFSLQLVEERGGEMGGPLGPIIGRYPSSNGDGQMGGGIIRHNRKCRDLVFLVIFIAFWVAMIVNSSFGFNQGNPLR